MTTTTTAATASTRRRIARPLALATTLVAALTVGIAAPAAAADEVIAADTAPTTVAAAVAAVPTAAATRPRAITVSRHGGHSVTLFAKGEQIRRAMSPGSAPVTFTGLTAGRTYVVAIGGEPIGAVVALDAPAAASRLTVRRTATPSTVALTWQHRPTVATGGRSIAYDVVATTPGSPAVRATVIGTLSTTLSGLKTDALYRFSVTPRNSAGRGKASTAAMTRTLAQLGGAAAVAAEPAAPTPAPAVPSAVATPVATPVSAPAPAPAPAPRPASTTIYLCPEGYLTAGDLCRLTRAYIFHTETLTSAYTYHQEFVQTGTDSFFSADCSTGGVYYPNGDRGAGCYRWQPTGYYTTAKDAAPAGYTDDGTQWVKETQVKDALPEGFTDDGTQWVTTTAKVARVVTM